MRITNQYKHYKIKKREMYGASTQNELWTKYCDGKQTAVISLLSKCAQNMGITYILNAMIMCFMIV